MRRFVLPKTTLACAVFAMAALSGLAGTAARAQMPQINMMPEMKSQTPEEKERDQEADKAYRESLRKIPDSKTANDPWGSVRGAEAKPVKPAAPKAAKTTQVKRPAKTETAPD